MNALKGALAVLIFELALWLFPGETDAAFMSLPMSLRIFIVLALGAMMLSACWLFSPCGRTRIPVLHRTPAMTNLEQIQYLLNQQFPGKSRTDSDVLYWIKGALGVLLKVELERATAPKEAEPIHMEKNP